MPNVTTPQTGYRPQDPNINRSLQASQTQLAAVSKSKSLDMDLVTEEGDKVSLSIDSEASAVYAAHGEVGMDDKAFEGKWAEVSAGKFEREVTFKVEGDLNEQERREIKKVIKTINRMMHDFVQGKLNPMMDKADKLKGLETIESLEVDMSYERQVLVAQQTQAAVGYDKTGEIAPAPVSPAKAVEAPIKKEAETVAKKMAKEVAAAEAPKEPLKEVVGRLLNAYRNLAKDWNPMGERIMDQVRDMFEGFFEAAEQASVKDETEPMENAIAMVDEAKSFLSYHYESTMMEKHTSISVYN